MSNPQHNDRGSRSPRLSVLAVTAVTFAVAAPALAGTTVAASAAESTTVTNQASGRNLVANGGFEQGSVNWKPASQATLTVKQRATGTRFARVRSTTRGPAVLKATSNVVSSTQAGHSYLVSAQVRTNRPTVNGVLRASETKATTTVSRKAFAITGTRWKTVSFTVRTATTGGVLRANVKAFSLPTTTAFDVDNVKVSDVTAAAAPTPEVAASTGTGPLLGVYNGGPTTDDATKSAFGAYPDIASSYYQGNASINLTAETARISKGIVPFITVTSRNSGYTLKQIGSGTADAWIDRYATSFATLQSKSTRPVMVTLDHEFEVKLNQQQFGSTPPTIADFQAAFNRFRARVEAKASAVRVGYWFGASDKTKIQQVGSGLSGVEWIAYDPYSTDSHSASETFEQTVTPTYTWLKGRTWYKGQPVFLGEFGSALEHGDASVANWMTSLRTHMKNVGLAGGLLFNRQKTEFNGDFNGWKLDTGTTPRALAAFKASLMSTS